MLRELVLVLEFLEVLGLLRQFLSLNEGFPLVFNDIGGGRVKFGDGASEVNSWDVLAKWPDGFFVIVKATHHAKRL